MPLGARKVEKKTRPSKVEHKAPGMCGQGYVLFRIRVDRPTYRQSKMSKDEIRGLLNLADIFCFQLHVKFLCLINFDIFLTDKQTDQTTGKGDHRSSFPDLKNHMGVTWTLLNILFVSKKYKMYSLKQYRFQSVSVKLLHRSRLKK